MALTLYPVPGKEKSKLICNAFAAGAPRHATGAVFFGTEGVMQAFRRAQQGTWFYIDNSYFDPHRGIYFRATKNALQVDPTGKASTGERFAKLLVTKDSDARGRGMTRIGESSAMPGSRRPTR